MTVKRIARRFVVTTSLIVVAACQKHDSLALCPDLAFVGKGSMEFEEANRCVRVMAARYSVSNQSPADVATAAIDFCREYKFEPLTQGLSPETADKILDQMIAGFRNSAIRTVVEMRSANCITKTDLFKHIDDPINRPKVS